LAVSTLTVPISAPKATALRARKATPGPQISFLPGRQATAGQEPPIQQRSFHHLTNAGQQIAACGYTPVEPFLKTKYRRNPIFEIFLWSVLL
jgi:hypothetical protein